MPRRKQQGPTPLNETKYSAPKNEEETKRIVIENKKEQEVSDRKKQDALERLRRDEEEKKKKKAELAAKVKAEEERARKEAEERRKTEHEEHKRVREEEDRKKRVEVELKKKMDDDKKKAEERKKKMDEERKKRQEEDKRLAEERRLKQEEETRRLEEEHAELTLKAANNDFSFLTSTSNRTTLAEPEVDLLGGGSDDDEYYAKNKNPKSKGRRGIDSSAQLLTTDNNDDGTMNNIESGIKVNTSTHRLAPQRGRVDELTDNLLDRVEYKISLKKQGKKDGVYLFGQKMMRVQLNISQQLRVLVGRDEMTIEDFVNKFERVEGLRQKGLESALMLTKFMQNGSNSSSIPFE